MRTECMLLTACPGSLPAAHPRFLRKSTGDETVARVSQGARESRHTGQQDRVGAIVEAIGAGARSSSRTGLAVAIHDDRPFAAEIDEGPNRVLDGPFLPRRV